MPITINGTTVTNNYKNGAFIISETVNETIVYGGEVTVSRVWYYYAYESSMPSISTPYTKPLGQLSPTRANLEASMTSTFPPANIPVGTVGWLHTTFGEYYLLMIIEE